MKIHSVEQRSPAWFAIRCGIPTASEFSKLITSTGEISKSLPNYAITLAGEKFAGRELDGIKSTPWMDRGCEMELEAVRCYQLIHDQDVDSVGFITDDAMTIGCSPDGLVGADGGVEIKCLSPENHIKAILYHQKNGRCPPDYVQQAQGTLLINGRRWHDLVFYHPDLPLLVIRQVPDIKLHASLRNAIDLVCVERDQVLAALHKAGPSALETAA